MKVNYLKSLNYIIYIMILIPIFTQAKGLLSNLSGDIGLEYKTETISSSKEKKVDSLSQVSNLH